MSVLYTTCWRRKAPSVVSVRLNTTLLMSRQTRSLQVSDPSSNPNWRRRSEDLIGSERIARAERQQEYALLIAAAFPWRPVFSYFSQWLNVWIFSFFTQHLKDAQYIPSIVPCCEKKGFVVKTHLLNETVWPERHRSSGPVLDSGSRPPPPSNLHPVAWHWPVYHDRLSFQAPSNCA